MAPGSNGSGAGDDDALSSEVAVLRDQVSSGSRRGGGARDPARAVASLSLHRSMWTGKLRCLGIRCLGGGGRATNESGGGDDVPGIRMCHCEAVF